MKAAVQRGKGKLAVVEVPTPKPGPGQILIKIAYCGICGSDLHYFTHEYAPSGNVLGHEWSGTVAEVGDGVDDLELGDRVTMGGLPDWLVPEMPPPTSDDPAQLIDRHPAAHAGGFAEYLLYTPEAVHRIPEGVTLEEAAMTDTLGVGLAAVNRLGVEAGASVLIIGAGPIGLSVLLGAKLAEAGRIVVTDMVEGRRAAAKSLGADVVLDPREISVQDEVFGLTGGVGPDVVFESAGVPSTIQEAVNLVKTGGRVGMVGVTFEPAEIIPAIWFLKGVTFMAIPGGDLVASLGALARKSVDVKPLITHTVPLDRIQEAFEGLLKPTNQIKVLIRP